MIIVGLSDGKSEIPLNYPVWILDLANGVYNLSSRVCVLRHCDRVVASVTLRN